MIWGFTGFDVGEEALDLLDIHIGQFILYHQPSHRIQVIAVHPFQAGLQPVWFRRP